MSELPRTDCLWWYDTPPIDLPQRVEPADKDVDFAIVGAGFTGLWTATHLKTLLPNKKIIVLEAHRVGHGASGRNGGWLMGSCEGLSAFCNGTGQLPKDVITEFRDLVPNFVSSLKALAIDCDLKQGGGIFGAARYPAQRLRAKTLLESLHQLGFDERDYRWLSREELTDRVSVHNGQGGIYTPLIATLNPAKLLQGLVRAARDKGVAIYERSPATLEDTGILGTPSGNVNTNNIIWATEAYSSNPPLKKRLLAVQSGIVCTEPLSHAQWNDIGFDQHEAFCDLSRASTYLQRTADDRLIVGARGAYAFNNRARDSFSASAHRTNKRIALGRALFPQLDKVTFTHSWEGSLGIGRTFRPHIVFDPQQRIATAGGYIGEGVGASYLFALTLAEGFAAVDSPRLSMPWVHRGNLASQLRRWEHEPLPWLGFNGAMSVFDVEEFMINKAIPGARAVSWLCDRLEGLIGH